MPGAPIDLLGIIAWTAENERNATRERTMGNRRRLRANGAFGLPPLGYTVEDRRLVIVPEHALIVVRIYTDSANGVSVRKIVDWLRVECPRVVVGRTKKHVMQWTTNSVLKILIWGQGVGSLQDIFAFGLSPADWAELSRYDGNLTEWTDAALSLTEKRFGLLPAELNARMKARARAERDSGEIGAVSLTRPDVPTPCRAMVEALRDRRTIEKCIPNGKKS